MINHHQLLGNDVKLLGNDVEKDGPKHKLLLDIIKQAVMFLLDCPLNHFGFTPQLVANYRVECLPLTIKSVGSGFNDRRPVELREY